jgi:hypothetical protein
VFAGEGSQVEGVDVPVVLLGPGLQIQAGTLQRVLVEQSLVVNDHAALVEVVEVLREGLDLLVAVNSVGTVLWVAGEAIAQCQQEVEAVSPRPDGVCVGPYLDVGVAAPNPGRVVSVCEYVQSRAHQCLGEILARGINSVTGATSDAPH